MKTLNGMTIDASSTEANAAIDAYENARTAAINLLWKESSEISREDTRALFWNDIGEMKTLDYIAGDFLAISYAEKFAALRYSQSMYAMHKGKRGARSKAAATWKKIFIRLSAEAESQRMPHGFCL